MSNEWKNKTCETCNFNSKNRCLFNPPIAEGEYGYVNYPRNRHTCYGSSNEWFDACSKYEEKI